MDWVLFLIFSQLAAATAFVQADWRGKPKPARVMIASQTGAALGLIFLGLAIWVSPAREALLARHHRFLYIYPWLYIAWAFWLAQWAMPSRRWPGMVSLLAWGVAWAVINLSIADLSDATHILGLPGQSWQGLGGDGSPPGVIPIWGFVFLQDAGFILAVLYQMYFGFTILGAVFKALFIDPSGARKYARDIALIIFFQAALSLGFLWLVMSFGPLGPHFYWDSLKGEGLTLMLARAVLGWVLPLLYSLLLLFEPGAADEARAWQCLTPILILVLLGMILSAAITAGRGLPF